MKEYIEPIVEVIELSEADVIVTSGPKGTGEDNESNPESILKSLAKNGLFIE